MNSVGSQPGRIKRRRSADDEPATRTAEASAAVDRPTRAVTYPPGPSRLREATLYGEGPTAPYGLIPIPIRYHRTPPVASPASLVYSPWDVRLSPIDYSENDKGKQREDEDETSPIDSLSPVATGSIPSSAGSPRELSEELPIRIRRVGALGISVASESEMDVDDEPRSTRKRAGSRRPADDLEMETSGASSGDERDVESSAGGLRPRRRRKRTRGISEGQFRSIVDELSLENQRLKAQLRQHEVAQLPTAVMQDRMFEVRFFDGLPSPRREELSGMLARYVQRLPSSPTSPTAPAATATAKPISPPHLLAHATEYLDKAGPDSLQPPVIPDRPVHRERRKRNEREMLAGPSNSGVEPPSLTGTGSGIRFDAEAEAGRKVKRVKLERSPSSPAIAALDARDEPRATELIGVLERLFEDSLPIQETGHMSPTISGGTNEAYLGHLLENDDLSGGWTFLNLVCTMAQIHRFNVTIPFVRSAVHYLSHNLELSSDGTKIRWIGPCPHNASPTLRSVPEKVASPPISRSSSSSRSVSTLGDQNTSSSEGIARGFDSNGTSTEASTAATSVAPHPSEILHKATRLVPSHLHVPATAPATTLEGSSADVSAAAVTSSDEDKKAPAVTHSTWAHRFIPCPYRSQGGQARTPSSDDDEADKDGSLASPAVGTIVFYSDVGYCSDFSKTAVLPQKNVPRSMPFVPLGLQPLVEVDEPEVSPFGSPLSSLESVDDLAIIYGAEGILSSSPLESNSPATIACSLPDSGLDLFRTTKGMSHSIATDLFTLLVRTRWNPLPPLSPETFATKRSNASGFKSEDLAAFPTKQLRFKHETVSATTIYHESRIIPRRPIFLQTLSSDEDSLTATTSSRSSSPNERRRQILRPPSPDYLLSLSLPFFKWAPRETGTAYRWSADGKEVASVEQSGSTAVASVDGTRQQPDSAQSRERSAERSVAVGSSSEESPIDLDASVGSRSFKIRT